MSKPPSVRVGASLHPVTDLWPIISETLGISLEQASEFVISKFEDLQLELWVDSQYDGLWRTTQNLNSSDMMALRDAVSSAKKDGWTPDTYQLWSYQRLAPFGFNAIKNAAMEIKNFDDSEQTILVSPAVSPATGPKRTELITIPLMEYEVSKREYEMMRHDLITCAKTHERAMRDLDKANSHIKDLTSTPKKNETGGDPRIGGYLNIVGALVGLMLGRSPAGKPLSSYENQAAIISALEATYGNVHGISKSNLELKFAEANRKLNAK